MDKILEVKNLKKEYKDFSVENINFSWIEDTLWDL